MGLIAPALCPAQDHLPGDADGEALANLLRATMNDGDRRLRKLGFEITSIRHCAGGKPSASRETAELVNNLLREIYANIARHAPREARLIFR